MSVGEQLVINQREQDAVLADAQQARQRLFALLTLSSAEDLAEFDQGGAASLVQQLSLAKYKVRALRADYIRLAALA